MSTQKEWREIAYQRKVGADGNPGMTSYSRDVFNNLVPARQAEQRAHESMMRSVSAPPMRFDAAPPERIPSSSADIPAIVGHDARGTLRPLTSPQPYGRQSRPLPLRLAQLAVPCSLVAALVWSLVIQDTAPIAAWWNGFIFCVQLIATALGLVVSQIVVWDIEV
jgi:hypothetical protein